MATQADFNEEEWARLERAPFVAGMAISIADPGGPIEAVKETSATLKSVLAAAERTDGGELVTAVAKTAVEDARARKNPLAGFKPRGAMAGAAVLDELRAVRGILDAKATPEDSAEFGDFIVATAQAAADAAKEGGFMGFHAEQVSKGEQQMLDKLREVFPAPRGLTAAPGAAILPRVSAARGRMAGWGLGVLAAAERRRGRVAVAALGRDRRHRATAPRC